MHAQWWPNHCRYSFEPPKPGDLLPYQHAVYRVIAVHPLPPEQWTDDQQRYYESLPATRRETYSPVITVVRPVHIIADDPRARDHDLHLAQRAVDMMWVVYQDEHYPVCGTCGEPTPCRERLGMREAKAALDLMSRYENEGVCPHCRQVVTTRQKALTFPENLELPGGPPVTFHIGRTMCRSAATEYERRWIAADPTQRHATLT